MKKILYISGTRADFGLMRGALRAIQAHPQLDLTILATGMHLMPVYGMTVQEIEAAGFSTVRLPVTFDRDDPHSMAAFVGACTSGIADYCAAKRPDWLLLLGDRGEMLAGAVAATYLHIPAAHIHGGEVSSTVDESARHAITKLAHLHLPATEDSALRIRKMGEQPERIRVVGAPGLDGINEDLVPREALCRQLGLDPAVPFGIVLQHPVSAEIDQAPQQMALTLDGVLAMNLPSVVLYPNADAGGRSMITLIDEYAGHPLLRVLPHVERRVFLSMMAEAALMIGNSSSGIIEALSFDLPVVNVGTRQLGRLRGPNVLDVPHDLSAITAALHKALSDAAFLALVREAVNPYGDGHAAERIVAALAATPMDRRLIQKHITY